MAAPGVQAALGLTSAQKRAGRKFREVAEVQVGLPWPEDTETRPLQVRHVRHVCSLHQGRTWGLELREHYITSPKMYVCYCSAVLLERAHRDCQGSVVVEEGLFAYVWTYGRCQCGFEACSDGGQVVVRADRPPLRGAVQLGLEPTGWERGD